MNILLPAGEGWPSAVSRQEPAAGDTSRASMGNPEGWQVSHKL